VKDPRYIVVRRPFDGDPERDEEPRWEKVGYTTTLAQAQSLALKPVAEDGSLIDLTVGDLLCAMELEYVTPQLFPDQASELFVVTPSGVVPAPPSPGRRLVFGGPRQPWVSIWEGQVADAKKMVDWAWQVDRRRMALAACGLIRCSPKNEYTSPPGSAVWLAVEATERWAMVNATVQEARTAGSHVGGWGVEEEAAIAASNIAGSDGYDPSDANDDGPSAEIYVVDVLRSATYTRQDMAPIVRKWIPLSVILLARLGVVI
jgi:hypothetical protein